MKRSIPLKYTIIIVVAAIVVGSIAGSHLAGDAANENGIDYHVGPVMMPTTTTTTTVPAEVTTVTANPNPYRATTVKVTAWGEEAYGKNWSKGRMSLQSIKAAPGINPGTTQVTLQLCALDQVEMPSAGVFGNLSLVRPNNGLMPNQDDYQYDGPRAYEAEGTITVVNSVARPNVPSSDNPDYYPGDRISNVMPQGTCTDVLVDVFDDALAETYIGFGAPADMEATFEIQGEFTQLKPGAKATTFVYDDDYEG